MMKSTAKTVETPVTTRTTIYPTGRVAPRTVDPTAPYKPQTVMGSAAITAIDATNQLAGELRAEAGNHVINHKHVEDIAQRINDQMEALRASVVTNDA